MYAIDSLDIGITDNCNAGCPQCPRTDPETFKKVDWLDVAELTLEDIKLIIPPNQLKHIRNISLCGSYGDPLVAKDILSILKYFFEYSPNLNLSINTNGSMKSNKWWHELGSILRKRKVSVQFGIDGINQEQHERYRKRTNFNKILEHAQILKMYGVRICWQYIIFDYNKDDLETAKELSKKYKFDSFMSFVTERKAPSEDYSTLNTTDVVQSKRREQFNEETSKINHVDCIAENQREVHINAKGEVIPCCYFDTIFEWPRRHEDIIWSTYLQKDDDDLDKKFMSTIKMLRDFVWNKSDILDGKKHTVFGVVQNVWWEEFMDSRIDNEMCRWVCGKCK